MTRAPSDAHGLASAQRTEALEARVAKLEAELRTLRAKVDGAGPRFAALYAGFADRFRGSTAEVTAKLAAYLPDVRRLVAAVPGEVVDLGSGRGEWLTLLRDEGVPASGVDSHADFVEAARARGLNVVLGDAVAYLERLPPASVAMVTAFHLIEHVDTEALLTLLAAARSALRPGGVVLLETPNPANLRMAACDFYNDPTHRRPLPPALTEYLVTASGFVDVEVRALNPSRLRLEPTDRRPVEQLVVEALYGPQDYAVLGHKP